MTAVNATKHNQMLNIFTSFNIFCLVLCGEILHLLSRQKGRKEQLWILKLQSGGKDGFFHSKTEEHLENNF